MDLSCKTFAFFGIKIETWDEVLEKLSLIFYGLRDLISIPIREVLVLLSPGLAVSIDVNLLATMILSWVLITLLVKLINRSINCVTSSFFGFFFAIFSFLMSLLQLIVSPFTFLFNKVLVPVLPIIAFILKLFIVITFVKCLILTVHFFYCSLLY